MTAEIKTELLMVATGGTSVFLHLQEAQSVLTFATAGISFIVASVTAIRMFRKKKKKDE